VSGERQTASPKGRESTQITEQERHERITAMTESPKSETPKASWHARLRQQHAGETHAMVEPNQGNPPTQQTPFDRFLMAVQQRLQPEGRAQHQFHMNQYLCSLLPQNITLADLALGWQALTTARADDSSAVLSRRTTCAKLAAIAGSFTEGAGTLDGARQAWQVWRNAAQASDDPRLVAQRETFARELEELQAAISAEKQ
jgi:hypothetical protein